MSAVASRVAVHQVIPTTQVATKAVVAERTSLGQLFWMFLKIGCVSFGGFTALISAIADTMVEKHKLLSNDDILDSMSLANRCPGPQGVNCVAHIGYRLRGAAGALVCTVGVLLPMLGMIAATAAMLHTALPAWPEVLSAATIAAYVSELLPTVSVLAAAWIAMAKLRLGVVWVISAAGLCGWLIY